MFASVWVSELEYACISLCVRGYMYASVCSVQRECIFASVWMSQIECLFASVSMSVHVCFSLIVSSDNLHVCFSLSVTEWVSVCISVYVSSCLFQSDCQFRESACLHQPEYQSLRKNIDGRNSSWGEGCPEWVSVCISVYVLVSVCISVYVSWGRESVCISLSVSSERVHVCFMWGAIQRKCMFCECDLLMFFMGEG